MNTFSSAEQLQLPKEKTDRLTPTDTQNPTFYALIKKTKALKLIQADAVGKNW
jgi:hypothetical protein